MSAQFDDRKMSGLSGLSGLSKPDTGKSVRPVRCVYNTGRIGHTPDTVIGRSYPTSDSGDSEFFCSSNENSFFPMAQSLNSKSGHREGEFS